ncbi:hypothetical protein CVIRNUC_007743 [Coccomyxa viridis]|uniref:Cytochrome P450 n=1 Tax=Coccomyxa viridis TaxID=1274662 RepID=A0AAV1IBY8_9CHLO|nr:hypothetical protein CVIRNUC_007743 [Coccomyxa viridis]
MPVVPLLVRAAQKDVQIGDTVVPRGSLMTAHFLAMHTSARYWERPKDFIPERWLDPDCEYARPIDPSSTHVPMGPAGHSGADSKGKGMDKPVGPLVTASCTQDGMRGAMASDPYTFKGQRVRRYMPYGSGSRECLGMPQARVTMLATLAVMLSRFSFRLADKMGSAEDMRKAEVYRITVSLKDGLWMHCHPRAAWQTIPPATAR